MGERDRIDRLDLAAQASQRPPAKQPQHVRVAPLAFHAVGAELAAQDGPRPEHAFQGSSTMPTGRPQRRAGWGVRKGPCVRAKRASSPSSAPTAGPRNASGTPTGGVTPTASR